jgi:hypothetical protein
MISDSGPKTWFSEFGNNICCACARITFSAGKIL